MVATKTPIPDRPDVPAASVGTSGAEASTDTPVLEALDLTLSYGTTVAVKGVSLAIPAHEVTAIIGPSGCGKSTLLRTFNRMNDDVEGFSLKGGVRFQGEDIYARSADPVALRRRVGMVFQKPNPFPRSVYKNVAWGPKINGYTGDMDALVESSLRRAALWDEVKDDLGKSGLALSGGQQQRLCIARTIAMQPEVILMDEPCSALDPASTARIEDLIFELKKCYTILIVTHNMQQASRASDRTAFLCEGRLVEYGPTQQVFTRPEDPQTEAYVSGRFG